jgi:hypothetical protein
MNLQPGRRHFASALWAVVILYVLLVGTTGYAGSTNAVQAPTLPDQAKAAKKPKIATRPMVIGSTLVSDSTKPGRPSGDTSAESQAVSAQINKLQSARQAYLAAQKDLSLRLATSSEEQRALIREEVKDALAKWKEEQTQFIAEQKERMKQIKQELQPDLGRVVDVSGDGTSGGRGR